ncbi:unnamed protein product, partial [Rotaria magnacalcarata]
PPPTPIVEQQPQPQLQISPPANNKAERRLSHLHVVQQSSSIDTHSTAPGRISTV